MEAAGGASASLRLTGGGGSPPEWVDGATQRLNGGYDAFIEKEEEVHPRGLRTAKTMKDFIGRGTIHRYISFVRVGSRSIHKDDL